MHIRFTSSLEVTEEYSGTVWRLLSPLTVEVADEVWEVPADFLTDFSSIPRPARSVIPVLGKQNKASVLHDWFYAIKKVSRDKADKIFLAAMRASGVSWVKRTAMYLAVRAGGWWLYYDVGDRLRARFGLD